MNKKLIIILLMLIIFSLSGCMLMIKTTFGIQDPKIITNAETIKYAEKFKIPIEDNFSLDTTYFDFILSLDTNIYKSQIKNHYQPLQALYFDSLGNLCRYYINCYAGGFPNLKWNRNGKLNTFPPAEQAPIDSIINLFKQLTFLNNCCNSDIITLTNLKPDYTVVVYWNHFMRRHSKRLIKLIKSNCELANGEKIKLIFVNNDNAFEYVNRKQAISK
ncbi:MAG: hypothetical protein K9J13_12035 [Saprospiraceae bacterium]|nr:hypothetical protein [Saprospiraceae bacterium]